MAETVAALGRELDRLRHQLSAADLDGMRSGIAALAGTVAGLAEQVADLAAVSDDETSVPSWLWPPEPGRDVASAGRVLAELVTWIGHVYAAFPDGRLPSCWLWHPHAVEELVWLWRAWLAAYRGPAASPMRAADWHDRMRPGVARRIGAAIGACSLRAHLTPAPDPHPPADYAILAIAAWRATPGRPAPVPTTEQVAAADSAEAAAAWT